jgi:hypothetical protein
MGCAFFRLGGWEIFLLFWTLWSRTQVINHKVKSKKITPKIKPEKKETAKM